MSTLACQASPFLQSLDTKVVSCKPYTLPAAPKKKKKKKNKSATPDEGKQEQKTLFQIVLEDTVLFPEGGGQPCDFGRIGDARVSNAFHDAQGDAVHVTDAPFEVVSPRAGENLICLLSSSFSNHSFLIFYLFVFCHVCVCVNRGPQCTSLWIGPDAQITCSTTRPSTWSLPSSGKRACLCLRLHMLMRECVRNYYTPPLTTLHHTLSLQKHPTHPSHILTHTRAHTAGACTMRPPSRGGWQVPPPSATLSWTPSKSHRSSSMQ
jgi:hypothetical protein